MDVIKIHVVCLTLSCTLHLYVFQVIAIASNNGKILTGLIYCMLTVHVIVINKNIVALHIYNHYRYNLLTNNASNDSQGKYSFHLHKV